MLLEDDGLSKTPKLEKGMLFDLFPIDIINVINDWIIRLGHYGTFNIIVERIKYPYNILLHMHKHQHWVPYLYLRHYFIYQETKFHWADRYYVKNPCSFGPDTLMVEHNKA